MFTKGSKFILNSGVFCILFQTALKTTQLWEYSKNKNMHIQYMQKNFSTYCFQKAICKNTRI